MLYILIVIIIAYIIYLFYNKAVPKNEDENIKINQSERLPYRLRDDFLSTPERSFYSILKAVVLDSAVICPKVGLKDIFFVSTNEDGMKHFNRIAKKHVDFLLCDPSTMKPICGIELDDSSHTGSKAYKRDVFVEKVYKDAEFKLLRFSTKATISEIDSVLLSVLKEFENLTEKLPQLSEVPICPKCGIPMISRKATKGENEGKEFYGCVNYPRCKELKNKV